MGEPASSGATALTVTTLSTLISGFIGEEAAFLTIVILGSFLGAAGGGISSDTRGYKLGVRMFIAFVAGVFSSAFELLDSDLLPPTFLAAIVAYISVDPKKNLSELLSMANKVMLIADRLRGKK